MKKSPTYQVFAHTLEAAHIRSFRQLKNIKFVCGSCAACWQSQLMVEDKVRPQAGPKSQQVTMLVVVESITIEIPVLLDKITFNISYYTM